MESGALVDVATGPGTERRLDVVVSAEDQLTLRRMALALADDGLAPVTHAGEIDELGSIRGESAVVAIACDVAEPRRMAVLRRLRRLQRRARIVVVSPRTSGTGVRRALEAGADGVVVEGELEATLAPTVRAVAAGQTAVPRRLRTCVEKPAFSHREKQVLRLVAEGLTNSEIAERLFLSESTVKSHLSTAFAKLGVRSRKEAAALVLDPEGALGAILLEAGEPTPAGARTRGAP
jgi:DNA-binding NarL/FixJ family response regulator